jgi:hypothetical protein
MDKMQLELTKVIEKYFGADAGYLDISCLDLARVILEAGWTKPEWIPVKERLPEDGVLVLCWYEYFRFGNYNRMFQTYGIGYYFHVTNTWGGEVSNGQQTKVLAWMPLPEAPKGE